MKERLTYKDAGVDTKEGERAVELLKNQVKRTFDSNVLTGLGSFGSLYKLDLEGIKNPVLVSGTDGVGTKLKIAFMMDKHNTVGQDCVAMCVNDILCQGARPLFFLDYIATGKVSAEKISEIVGGIADGCVLGECALVGGETAEMPGFYQDGEYDMAGFAVGIVDKEKIIDGNKINTGHAIIGIPSSGIHSNGYSLVRKLFFDKLGMNINEEIDELGETLGNNLLTPTKIYTKACNAVLKKVDVDGIVHITGGGFFENIPRIIPKGLGVMINMGSWEAPPIFNYIKEKGDIEVEEMFATFNMGIGLMMFVKENNAQAAINCINQAGEKAYVIGKVIEGNGVTLC